MTDTFDPYHAWLGIPKAEQPCDYYRVLGLVQFESDLDVIESAAERQMAHVRRYQTKHTEAATELLTELAKARSCLLMVKSKERYDESLRQSQPAELESHESLGQEEMQLDLLDRVDLPLDLHSLPATPVSSQVWKRVWSKKSHIIVVFLVFVGINIGITFFEPTRSVDDLANGDDESRRQVLMAAEQQDETPDGQTQIASSPPPVNSENAKAAEDSGGSTKKAIVLDESQTTESYGTIDLLQRIKQTQPTLPRGWGWNANMLVVGPRGNGSLLKVSVPELRDVPKYTIVFQLWKYGRSTGKPLFYFIFPIDRGAHLRARYYYGRSAALAIQSINETVEPGPFAGGSRAFVHGNKRLEIQVNSDRTRVLLEGSSTPQEFITPRARSDFEEGTPDFQIVGISGRSMHYRIVKFQVSLPKSRIGSVLRSIDTNE